MVGRVGRLVSSYTRRLSGKPEKPSSLLVLIARRLLYIIPATAPCELFMEGCATIHPLSVNPFQNATLLKIRRAARNCNYLPVDTRR